MFKLFSKIIETNEREIINICSLSKKQLSEILNILKSENLITINKKSNYLLLNNLKESKDLIINYKNLVYNMIYSIKIDLDDKINSLENRGSQELQEEYMNKAFSYISMLDDIILIFENFKKQIK